MHTNNFHILTFDGALQNCCCGGRFGIWLIFNFDILIKTLTKKWKNLDVLSHLRLRGVKWLQGEGLSHWL